MPKVSEFAWDLRHPHLRALVARTWKDFSNAKYKPCPTGYRRDPTFHHSWRISMLLPPLERQSSTCFLIGSASHLIGFTDESCDFERTLPSSRSHNRIPAISDGFPVRACHDHICSTKNGSTWRPRKAN